MISQLSSPTESIESRQLRSWTRFPPDTRQMCVILGDQRKLASVLDESYGGIGVTIELEDMVNVHVGDSVIVLYYDCPTPAHVQWIQRNPAAQKMHLGICWVS